MPFCLRDVVCHKTPQWDFSWVWKWVTFRFPLVSTFPYYSGKRWIKDLPPKALFSYYWEKTLHAVCSLTWWSRRCHNDSSHLPQQRPKGSAQADQEPGHLPKAVGQAIQVFGQMNQPHLQPSCAEDVVHESHQLAASVPYLDDLKEEASWKLGQNLSGCREYNQWHACSGGAQTEGVCASCEQLLLELHPQSTVQDPYLQPTSPGLPQVLWHCHAFRSL